MEIQHIVCLGKKAVTIAVPAIIKKRILDLIESPQKLCWIPNPQWILMLIGNKVFVDGIKMR